MSAMMLKPNSHVQLRCVQIFRINASVEIFKANGLADEFAISDSSLMTFVLTVKENYHENPFHNWMHAFSVLHAAWMMANDLELGLLLTKRDILAVLIAAICREYGTLFSACDTIVLALVPFLKRSLYITSMFILIVVLRLHV